MEIPFVYEQVQNARLANTLLALFILFRTLMGVRVIKQTPCGSSRVFMTLGLFWDFAVTGWILVLLNSFEESLLPLILAVSVALVCAIIASVESRRRPASGFSWDNHNFAPIAGFFISGAITTAIALIWWSIAALHPDPGPTGQLKLRTPGDTVAVQRMIAVRDFLQEIRHSQMIRSLSDTASEAELKDSVSRFAPSYAKYRKLLSAGNLEYPWASDTRSVINWGFFIMTRAGQYKTRLLIMQNMFEDAEAELAFLLASAQRIRDAGGSSTEYSMAQYMVSMLIPDIERWLKSTSMGHSDAAGIRTVLDILLDHDSGWWNSCVSRYMRIDRPAAMLTFDGDTMFHPLEVALFVNEPCILRQAETFWLNVARLEALSCHQQRVMAEQIDSDLTYGIFRFWENPTNSAGNRSYLYCVFPVSNEVRYHCILHSHLAALRCAFHLRDLVRAGKEPRDHWAALPPEIRTNPWTGKDFTVDWDSRVIQPDAERADEPYLKPFVVSW